MENKKTLTKEEILGCIEMLARSQGFYGRLLREIRENDRILEELEKQGFTDILDIVLFLEQ